MNDIYLQIVIYQLITQRCQSLRNILTNILNRNVKSQSFSKNLQINNTSIFKLKFWLIYSEEVGISDHEK